ncbi:MAG: extracellular solute-binding protein [Candidatus Gracilibacteria bacterium]|jgi:ABC-type glycerol-3-phosphate transport system substrate-binding protein
MKKYLVYFLILSLSFSLSACRSKDDTDNKDDYSGVTLTYYKVFDGSDVMEPMLSEYRKKHPGLDIVYKKFDDFDEYQKVVINEMAEGKGPDIFSMPNTWFMANYKKLAPMPSDLGTPDVFADIYADVAYKDLVRVDDNGDEQVYGIPLTIDTLALYYNKAHFEDRLSEQGKPSNTWEGIKSDVFALNKFNSAGDGFDVSGIAMGRADNISRAVDIFYLLFLQHGGNFYDQYISKATFASQRGKSEISYPGLEALRLFLSFSDSESKNYAWNEFSADHTSDAQEVAAFAQGKVSMIVGYSYTYQDIVDQIRILESQGVKTIDKSDIKTVEIPQLYDPSTSTEKRVTYASYFAEAVSKNSEHPDIAWDLLTVLGDKPQLEMYYNKTHKPTSRRDMINDQKKDPVYGVFARQIGYAESFPIIDYYRYKEIFAGVINKATQANVTNADFIDAQDLITRMIVQVNKNGLLPVISTDKKTDADK